MKTTKGELLKLENLLAAIEKQVPHTELKPFKYAILRNQMRLKPIAKERDAIGKSIFSDWDVEDKTDLQAFDAYATNTKEFKEFFAEEVDFDFYTLDIEKLEGLEDYNLEVAEALLGTIIVEK